MRISDWSSDVCSSDLALSAFEVMWPEYVQAAQAARGEGRALPDGFQGRRAVLAEIEGECEASLAGRLEQVLARACEDGLVHDVVLSASGKDARQLWQIGRASCRDRVCQYV